MSFAQDAGYIPLPFDTMMSQLRVLINTATGNTYDEASFVGTSYYKFCYAILQQISAGEIKTSEVFQKLQEYIATTNEAIQRPSVSYPGLLESFESHEYVVSVREPTDGNRGKIAICIDLAETLTGGRGRGSFTITDYTKLVSGTDDSVGVGATTFTFQTGAVTPGGATAQAATSNAATATSLAAQINAHATAGALVYAQAFGATVQLTALLPGTAGNLALAYTDNDANVGATKSGTAMTGGSAAHADYAATKTEIGGLIRDFVCAGLVSEGLQEQSVTLSNGQSFDMKWNLPNRIAAKLRLTLVTSENNLETIPDDEDLRQQVFDQVNERYRLGWDFEPQRYFSSEDAPFAASILLEYSFDDEETWASAVRTSAYDDLISFGLEDIEVVIS